MAPAQLIRIGTLLLLLLLAPAHAQPVAVAGGFDPLLVANVYATALAFMAPRTLEPVAVSQLAVWGLRGFTALDPDIVTELRDGKLSLAARDRVLLVRSSPADGDITGAPRRHPGHRAEFLRRAVQPP
jgi:carboxyl-terminal processing protease